MNEKTLYHIRTSLVVAVCAAVVLLMRFLWIPLIIPARGLMFPLSDGVIILGAGLCTHLYALAMFLIILFVELFVRNNDFASIFPLFLYLALSLTSSFAAENGWYKKKSLVLAAFALLEVELSLIYLIMTVTLTRVLTAAMKRAGIVEKN